MTKLELAIMVEALVSKAYLSRRNRSRAFAKVQSILDRFTAVN